MITVLIIVTITLTLTVAKTIIRFCRFFLLMNDEKNVKYTTRRKKSKILLPFRFSIMVNTVKYTTHSMFRQYEIKEILALWISLPFKIAQLKEIVTALWQQTQYFQRLKTVNHLYYNNSRLILETKDIYIYNFRFDFR